MESKCHPNGRGESRDYFIDHNTFSETNLTSLRNEICFTVQSAFNIIQAPMKTKYGYRTVSRMSLLSIVVLIIITIHLRLTHADQGTYCSRRFYLLQ